MTFFFLKELPPTRTWLRRLRVVAFVFGVSLPSYAFSAGPTPSSGLQSVVYLQKSAQFSVQSMSQAAKPIWYEGPLLREIQRQAFLIAARDQLGLTTRDALLGDWMPTAGENEPFALVMTKSDPPTLEVLRGFYPAAKTVSRQVPTITSPPVNQIYQQWLIDAEALSRTAYVEAIRKCGFQGQANVVRSEANVPEAIEKSLAEMTFTSQYIAIRRLHELLRAEGESPARLGALTRGYANLGMLAEFHWNPAHKVFKARALLYAQRLLTQNPQSCWAQWHRAYALAASGLHGLAIQDLDAAEKRWKATSAAHRDDRPGWVDLIDAHCRFDLARLIPENAPASYSQLTALLRYLSFDLSGDNETTLTAARELAAKMPECYRICDGIGVYGWGRTGDEGSIAWIRTVGTTIYSRVATMPDLPQAIGRIAQGVKNTTPAEDVSSMTSGASFALEFQSRAKLIDALLEVGRPAEIQQPGAKPDSGLANAGEPSWATLGQLIRELSFVQVRRLACYKHDFLSVSADELLKAATPLVFNHPYAGFLETYVSDRPSRNEAWKKMNISCPQDLELSEYPMWLVYYGKHHREQYDAIVRLLSRQTDQTARDLSLAMRYLPANSGSYVVRLLEASPYSPVGRAAAVDKLPDAVLNDRLPEWEKTADKYPRLCKALSLRYSAQKRFDVAAKWAKAAVTARPEVDNYRLLANAHWNQGKRDLWATTLEEALTAPDAFRYQQEVRLDLVSYSVAARDWNRAKRCAGEASVQMPGAWLLLPCYEGMQQWEDGDKLMRTLSEKYPSMSLKWYFFCRRTGHGSLEAARRTVNAYLQSPNGGQPFVQHSEEVAIYYLLEKKPEEALKSFSRKFDCNSKSDPISGLYVALLSDELKDPQTRDAALGDVVKRGARFSLTPPTYWRLYGGAPPYANLVSLAKLLADDLAKGGKGEVDLTAADQANDACRASLQLQPRAHPDLPIIFDACLARYLELHGKPTEAIEYWKKCVANTELLTDHHRTLAGAELCDHGIQPESYKSLGDKSGVGEESNRTISVRTDRSR